MVELRGGRVVHGQRDYFVAEVLQVGPDRTCLVGFSLAGPQASPSIIYASLHDALEAIHDLEQRVQDHRG
jgi:hypothetical protein